MPGGLAGRVRWEALFAALKVLVELDRGLPPDPWPEQEQELPEDPFPGWHLLAAGHAMAAADVDDPGRREPLEISILEHFLLQYA